MISLDTNILVYARRTEARHHQRASEIVNELSSGDSPWALTWVAVCEFLRVVTHPRIFSPPTELESAIRNVESLLESPSLQMLGEGTAHLRHLRRVLVNGNAVGNLVHDARIAALLLEHGVTEIWTADRDFHRFPGIRVVDPFV